MLSETSLHCLPVSGSVWLPGSELIASIWALSNVLWNRTSPVELVCEALPTDTETGASKPSESGATEMIPALTTPAAGIRRVIDAGAAPSRLTVVLVTALPIPESSDCQP